MKIKEKHLEEFFEKLCAVFVVWVVATMIAFFVWAYLYTAGLSIAPDRMTCARMGLIIAKIHVIGLIVQIIKNNRS